MTDIILLIEALGKFHREDKVIEVRLCAYILEKETGISRQDIFKTLDD